MDRKVIGICGRARSGKDTIADYLCKNGFVKIAFADKLKEILQDLFGLTKEQVYGDKKEIIDERWGKSPRNLLQTVGDVMRTAHEEVWIRYVVDTIYKNDMYDKWVVSDIRYKNELDAIKQIGAEIWLVKRPDAPDIEGSHTHTSETELITIPETEFHKVLVADSGVENLLKKIDGLIS